MHLSSNSICLSAGYDHLLQEDGDVNMADPAFLLLVLVSEIIIT